MIVVSAVIPTRGRPELLRRAVLSALAQTLREIEVVVVIDGEDPATRVALDELTQQDGRLRVLALAASVGGSDARNRGVDAAAGEWIAFLDDDDEWLPGKLQAQIDAVRASTASILIGTCRMIARTPGKDYVWPRRLPASDEQLGEYIMARRTFTRGEGYLQTSTFFVRRSLMQAQPFKSGQLKHQDTEWVLRLGRLPGTEVVFADEVLAIHNIEEDRTTVSSKSNWRYSLEWARRGIRLNMLECGWTAEDGSIALEPGDFNEKLLKYLPYRRLLKPEEIAGALLYLVSPAAGFVTGESIAVDGGLLCRV